MKSCLVILAGRCFNARNEAVPNLRLANPTWKIDTWVLGWDVDFEVGHNEVQDVQTRFQADVCELDNYREIGAHQPSFRLMTRWLARGADLIRARAAETYDVYIFARPELTLMKLDLDALQLTNSRVYVYSCPSYAVVQCSGICDWVTIGNRAAALKVGAMEFAHDASVSNETNLRRAYEKHGLECRIMGPAHEDVVKRVCDPRAQ